jgi:hypothetical protein
MSGPHHSLSSEEKDPSGRRQQWAIACSSSSAAPPAGTTPPNGSTHIEPLSGGASPPLSGMYASFRRASNVFLGSSGELNAPLRRATMVAGEHRSPGSRNPASSSGTSPGRGSIFAGRTRSLVAFSVAESASVFASGDESGISSFLAACLTANFTSVGYLFVPYGKELQPYMPAP